AVMEAQADVITTFGAGAVRRHPGPVPYGDHADGVDILNQPDLAKHFPYLTLEAKGAVPVRRAGCFGAQPLGSGTLAVAERNGAGAVRRHPGPVPYGDHPDRVDILNQPDLAKHCPYLTPEAKGAVHVRRAGWFSAQQLGSWMLEESERNGAGRVVDTVTAIDV